MTEIALTVNGRALRLAVEPRRLLADVLRHEAGCTGVHIGCAHGACGCCTVRVDGEARLSCLAFAVQCDGSEIETVDGLGGAAADHPLQRAFAAEHGLQCGFCTPGYVMALLPFFEQAVQARRMPDMDEIREAMAGNLCRCTGYQSIAAAMRRAIGDAIGEGQADG